MTVDRAELTWPRSLPGSIADDVMALIDAATRTDHTAPLSEHALFRLHNQENGRNQDGSHLLAQHGAKLVGYAHLDHTNPEEAVAELAVHPAHRRRGVGSAMVEALLQRGTPLRVWAHGEHPGAVRLAEKLGFRQVRTLWQMRRSLRELPEPVSMPEGVRVRSFVVGQDEAEFLRVNNAAFDWHPEQGGWGLEQVSQRESEPWFDPAGFLLAVDESDRLLGFHWTKVHTDPERIGEVYVVGVDPAEQGRKLGAALTLAGLHYLRGQGLNEVMLYVEAENHAAVKVYQNLGFTRWHTDAAFLR